MSLELYETLKVVGKGSYGEVWLTKYKKDNKQYVLKRMDLQNASKRERKAAEQEAKLLSSLKHPNIVSYKDSFETDDGYLYIAMGFCEGGDLYNRLKQQKGAALEERQLVEWFVQIAMALQYMHERNILHRDLKTQNIFLTKSKIIKLGDLGIARVLESSEDMASTLIGTPYYMSPELFSNRPYNHKSDVWALGCCVYEMATLKHAFNAKDMNSLVYKILKGKMPPMPKIYSEPLVDLIKLMLNQDATKRPSVNRILRNPFIKKNIAIFLENTKSRRPSTSSNRPTSGSRPGSGGRVGSGRRPSHDYKDGDHDDTAQKSRKKSHRSREPDSVSVGSTDTDAANSTSRSAIFDNPKPVEKPRPLPVPPSSGTPVKKKSASSRRAANTGDSGISTSTSTSVSSSVEPMDGETPRSRPNLSARSRRREKLKQEEGIETTPTNPPVLEKKRVQKSVSNPSASNVDEVDYTVPRESKSHVEHVHRQPSVADDDSSSESDTESSQEGDVKRKYRLKHLKSKVDENRSDREMNKFASLLETTLKMNTETPDNDNDDQSDDELEDGIEAAPQAIAENPSVQRLQSQPANMGIGVHTLSSSGRLMDRITILRKDCIKGLGVSKLHKAYEILDNIDGDDLEPKLVALLGKDDFDLYAGKIWQLKFCEESAFGLK